jgi:hypothetical protein
MPHHTQSRRPLVRPRVLWGGVATALLGAGLAGLGVILVSALVAVAGCVALALGAGLAWHGGLAYDTRRGTSLEHEAEEVVEGDAQPGTRPSRRIEDRELRRRAADQTRRTEGILARTTRGRAPALAPIGGVLLGLTAIGLALAIGALYPRDVVTPTRVDGLLVTILALTSIRVLTARKPTPLTATVSLAAGLMLLLLAWVGPDVTVVQGIRVVTGLLAVIASAICLLSPSRGPRGRDEPPATP